MAASLSELYLVVRGEDHVVLGVQWWGARPEVADGLTQLRVSGDGGGLYVTFPPQHVGEGAFADGVPIFITSGGLAGLSHVAVALAPGLVVPLDAAGILTMLATGDVLGRRFSDGAAATLIELPYGLLWSPTGATGHLAKCWHPATPVHSASGAVGLWRTRLRDGSMTSALGPDDQLLFAEPEVIRRDPEPGMMTLDAAKRQGIVDATVSAVAQRGAVGNAQVGRLELGALGGSLSARGSWPGLDWSQDIALGRDQHVKRVVHGILYPFGHRALYIEDTERKFDAADNTAALRMHQSLIVTEPSKSTVVDDAVLNRQFPFDDVEITTQVFSRLGDPRERRHSRPAPSTAALQSSIDQTSAELAAGQANLDPSLHVTIAFEDVSSAEATQFRADSDELASFQQELADDAESNAARDRLQEQIDGLQRQLDQIPDSPQTPDGEPSANADLIASLNAQIAELSQEMRNLPFVDQARFAALTNRATVLNDDMAALSPIIESQRNVTLTAADVVAGGSPDDPVVQLAQQVIDLANGLADLRQQLANAPTEPTIREWILGPTLLASSGGTPAQLPPLLFPLRCSTRDSAQPDVYLEVPLVFVAEFHLDAQDELPTFDSLTDGDGTQSLQSILDGFLGQHGGSAMSDVGIAGEPRTRVNPSGLVGTTLQLGGTSIDVVHGAQLADGDRIEVHRMTLTGIQHAGGFVPAISTYAGVLPAIRGVLGDAQSAIHTIGYRDEFLVNGDAEAVALQFVNANVGIDFRQQAEKSGGLLAPVIDASGISRLHGPVSIDGLLKDASGNLDPFKVLGDGATLLGFDLRSLVKDIKVPPEMVQRIVDGKPTIHVEWGREDVNPPMVIHLSDDGPFEGANATLAMTADISADSQKTQCTVRDVSLCFPSPGDPFLRVKFNTVQFTQVVGQQPDLSVDGVSIEPLGALKLVDDLKNHLGLGGHSPKIQVSTRAISVGYSFEVPKADCGEFTLQNIAFRAGLDVPFQPTDVDPILFSLGFASRAKPFNLSVMALGGGGYIDVELDNKGLRRMELSLEFGATLALDFGIVGAEVHALGGVRTEVGPGAHRAITGFVRIGGSVELLGLITVTVELLVTLRYDETSNAMVGRASVVVDIDLTLYSDSVELDSGEWKLLGGGAILGSPLAAEPLRAALVPDFDAGLEAWREYRRAFAKEVVP